MGTDKNIKLHIVTDIKRENPREQWIWRLKRRSKLTSGMVVH